LVAKNLKEKMRTFFWGILLGLIGGGLAVASRVPIQSSTGTSTGVELAVAASSQLEPTVTEVARAFERKTGTHVRLVFGESDELYVQIRKGADLDVFFSSDMTSPRRLVTSGAGVAASLREYGRDPLVMSISPMVRIGLPPGNPLLILRDKALSHVSIADPQHTLSGKAAEESFRVSRVYDIALRRKLLIGEDEAQVAQFLKTGDADVALLPIGAMRTYGLWSTRTIPIATNLYRPIRMGAVAITRSKHRVEGLKFLNFATSPDGQAIFRRDGF
jgi:molybdate transport system substrate-binding protein